MAVDERLVRFVEEALSRGVAREEIESAIAEAGWRKDESREAMTAFFDAGLPVPVPRPRPYLSAKEAFLYLVLFTALYLLSWHLGSLLFELIENAFPDPATDRYDWRADHTIRWAVAWIVIAFPVFLGLSVHLERGVRDEPTKRSSRVRKWLTYLTLYVAATVILCDLATLVFKALGGELTSRFLLKVLVVAAISGGVFGYYLGDLRAEERDDR